MTGEPKNPFEPLLEAAGLQKARERAKNLLERARLSEALQILGELDTEVDMMNIGGHFSKENKVFGGDPSLAPPGYRKDLLDLTEEQHKRELLRIALRRLRSELELAIGDMESVIIDIEATKAE